MISISPSERLGQQGMGLLYIYISHTITSEILRIALYYASNLLHKSCDYGLKSTTKLV